MRRLASLLAAATAVCAFAGAGQAQTVLKASHQFPGGKAGVVVLSDAWLAGAVASKRACIRKPEDIKGLKVRSAGPTFAAMWQQAGASIVSIPSNEVYNALQTGVADATDTSTGSFVSFRIYEQVKCITAPGDNALWFMYEPVLMSKRSFNRLSKEQQGALIRAGKKSQA